ncbi:uncharacterized protein [Dysidea avara]|uniref:uncharacterized protein n=1 Tax=Dysidea avara TaxID=196820 RepID=UPI00331A52F9
MSTNSNLASIVFACLVLFGLTDFCKSQVTITTQPSDVAVPSGGTAVFTCVVDLGDQNANTDDIKWDNMGNAITRVSTDPYMVKNDFGEGDLLISTLTIKNVNTQHAGLYQFVLRLNDGDVMSREASLNLLTATIKTQPRNITVCTGGSMGVAVFTCVVVRNGTNITSDDVMWQQIRLGGGISALSTSSNRGFSFNITTTISGDILTSTLTITGVADGNVLGTSSYRCVVKDMMSRNASSLISTAVRLILENQEIINNNAKILPGQMNFIVDLDITLVLPQQYNPETSEITNDNKATVICESVCVAVDLILDLITFINRQHQTNLLDT